MSITRVMLFGLLACAAAAGCDKGKAAGTDGTSSRSTSTASATTSSEASTTTSAAAAATTTTPEAATTSTATATAASATVSVDSKISSYKKTGAEVSGSIKSVGSDTIGELMTLWTEGFRKIYPNVQAEVEAKGSATAPPALIQGTATFGPVSREWKQEEVDKFEAKFGYKPTVMPMAIDMLAIYVNKDNPLKGITFQQIDAVFSKNRKSGAPKDIATWGDLGLDGDWKDKPINLYGRNQASGTYAYLKEHALKKGDYKDSVKEEPGSSAVVQAVASDKYGIGYSGIGYKTAGVIAVPVAVEGEQFIAAEAANAYSGKYPIARFLYVSLNYKPESKLDPLRAEFIKYMVSREGQNDVITAGYLPLLPKHAAGVLKMVGLGE